MNVLTSLFKHLREVINDGVTGKPSTKRWVLVVSTISLCIGFLMTTVAVVAGIPDLETIVITLAGILAAQSGSSYVLTKRTGADRKGSEG